MNVRVKYGIRPIEHISVQCPNCLRWFDGNEIIDDDVIKYESQMEYVDYICPVCGKIFGGYGDDENLNIMDCKDESEVYNGCMHKKVVWAEC